MDQVVGPHQCSFIAGRHSSDNIIVAQEVIHSMRTKRKSGQGWMMLKIDLEKAYDRLKWPFIEATLFDLGIDPWLVRAIMACVTTSSFQVLWNGEPTATFYPKRGIPRRPSLAIPLYSVYGKT